MNATLAKLACPLALTLAASTPLAASDGDAAALPGSSATQGNRIVCEGPGVGIHQSPGLCAQAVGDALDPGFKGGPGQAWKYMRDQYGMEVSNAHDCISMNCPEHAQDLFMDEEILP